MGYSRNYNSQPSSGGFAQKVKNVASLVGTVKSIYDTGKNQYIQQLKLLHHMQKLLLD